MDNERRRYCLMAVCTLFFFTGSVGAAPHESIKAGDLWLYINEKRIQNPSDIGSIRSFGDKPGIKIGIKNMSGRTLINSICTVRIPGCVVDPLGPTWVRTKDRFGNLQPSALMNRSNRDTPITPAATMRFPRVAISCDTKPSVVDGTIGVSTRDNENFVIPFRLKMTDAQQ